MLIACGTLLGTCVQAADRLADEGIDFGVINARFVKPLDRGDDPPGRARMPLVVTVEEGALMGGFGSAVLEAAADAGLDTSRIRRLGIPDRFIEHGSRTELLADLGLDAAGICGRAGNGSMCDKSCAAECAAKPVCEPRWLRTRCSVATGAALQRASLAANRV